MIYFMGTVMAGVFLPEEDISEQAQIAVKGEVVAAECLFSSENDRGVVDNTYTATINVLEVLKGEFSEASFTLISVDTIYPEGGEPNCDYSEDPHPIGEVGRYYLYTDEDELKLYEGGFFPDDSSNPQDPPACLLAEDSMDTGVEEVEEKAQTGCSSLNDKTSLLLLIPLAGLLLRRRF